MDGKKPQIVAVPDGLAVEVGPPEALKRMLEGNGRPCGTGRFEIDWTSGPNKGVPLTLYCAEPLCLQTGECTGPRFVPHEQQFTSSDPESPLRRPRNVRRSEIVEGVRQAALVAKVQTGVGDDRTDTEIITHVRKVIARGMKARDRAGGWGP